ncbi:MAG: hypothetical protein ABI369_06690 [Acetobacteraceae bacterium]
MKFWDASAIVPLLVAEDTTGCLQALAQRDTDMLAWWGSTVECAWSVSNAMGRSMRKAPSLPSGD